MRGSGARRTSDSRRTHAIENNAAQWALQLHVDLRIPKLSRNLVRLFQCQGLTGLVGSSQWPRIAVGTERSCRA